MRVRLSDDKSEEINLSYGKIENKIIKYYKDNNV